MTFSCFNTMRYIKLAIISLYWSNITWLFMRWKYVSTATAKLFQHTLELFCCTNAYLFVSWMVNLKQLFWVLFIWMVFIKKYILIIIQSISLCFSLLLITFLSKKMEMHLFYCKNRCFFNYIFISRETVEALLFARKMESGMFMVLQVL